MAHLRAVKAARAAARAFSYGENDGVAARERNDFAARLRPRALLDQEKLAADEVARRVGEKHRRLQRKHLLAVQILV
jgi:hypothetical protein